MLRAGDGLLSVPVYALYHYDSDSSTTFADSSGNGRTMFASGAASATTSQVKWGAKSLAPSTGYVASDPNGPWGSFDGDLTVDMWLYIPAEMATVTVGLLHINYAGAGTSGVNMYWDGADNNGEGQVMHMNDGGSVAAKTAINDVPFSQWFHVAFVQQCLAKRIYIDGVLKGEGWQIPYLGNNEATAYVNALGHGEASPPSPTSFTGRIDDLRIVRGAALYTQNFTPPTGPHGTTARYAQYSCPIPPAGTVLNSYYQGCDLYITYANGVGGTYDVLGCHDCC